MKGMMKKSYSSKASRTIRGGKNTPGPRSESYSTGSKSTADKGSHRSRRGGKGGMSY